jgi:hypothetical protein
MYDMYTPLFRDTLFSCIADRRVKALKITQKHGANGQKINWEKSLKMGRFRLLRLYQSAKYEFASSNTTRTTFAFDAYFVWKLAPLPDEPSGFFFSAVISANRRLDAPVLRRKLNKLFFHRKSIATIDAFEHVFNVANLYLACRMRFHQRSAKMRGEGCVCCVL